MTLQELFRAVDRLSPDERAELRTYIDQQPDVPAHETPVEERIHKMDEAARMIRESLTDEEWDEIERAMNDEYIEPIDEDGFPLI